MKVYILNEQQAERIKTANTNEVAFSPSYSKEIESIYISELDLLNPLFGNHKSIVDEFIDELQTADIDIYAL